MALGADGWGRLSEPAWVSARFSTWNSGRFGEAAPPSNVGSADLRGGTSDQCGAYFAPCSIQALIFCFCASVSVRCESGGGITSSSCGLVIRSHASLPAGSPGLIRTTPSCSA